MIEQLIEVRTKNQTNSNSRCDLAMHPVENTNSQKIFYATSFSQISLRDYLNCQIKGQADVVEQISRAIARSEMGLNKPNRPLGSFLLLGPTGVGKTELTKAVSKYLYKDEERFVRFDMAELQNEESLSLLLGTHKNEQGLLGNRIDELNRRGGGIILFDEIEKAHPKFNTLFLSALDEARITMSSGETKNLSKIYLFFTSNLGGAQAIKMENVPYATLVRHVRNTAAKHFRPETLARFEVVVVFNRLTHLIQVEICKGMIQKEINHFTQILNKNRKGKKLSISNIDQSVLNFLVRQGYTKQFGARPMRSAIERYMGDALADFLNSDCYNLDAITQANCQLAFEVENDAAIDTTALRVRITKEDENKEL